MATAATFISNEYEIKIYQLDKLNNKKEFLEKLEGICNREIKFPLQNNSLNNKIIDILGDEIIDVIDEKIVNLMTIGKDGNLYTYANNKINTIVQVEKKYYQKISDNGNNWNYIKLKKNLDSTNSNNNKTENNQQILKFETLNLKKQFRNVGGKNIKNTFVSILCKKKKKNEILAFIFFTKINNNIFLEDACGKDKNGEYLLKNMFDFFKEKNFETIKLTALPLVYDIWKTKYKFDYKDDNPAVKNFDDEKISSFIQNNYKFFLKRSLGCNQDPSKKNTFIEPLPIITIIKPKKKLNLNVEYSDYGIPMELNLNTLKNLDSNLKIPVEIPSTQNNYFKITGQYSNSKLLEFLISKTTVPSVSPVSPSAPPAPSPSKSPAASPVSPSVSPSKSPAVSPSVSPASPSSVSPASPSQASSQSKSSAPPASVVLEPRPKMAKDEFTAIVSKLEANGIFINYGNILKYRDVNLSTSSEINNICLWICQRQTRSLDSKNNEGKKLYSKCEFKNLHLILDTDFYKQLCNDLIKKNGDNNNYDFIINHNTENFTLCHNHIKQFLGVKMIFSGKKTGNKVQIKNLLYRPSDSQNSFICYYKNPLFVNGTFHKDLGNFIKKSNDRSLKNCYFEIEKDASGNELSHFEVKALRDIQKGEILYF